LQKLVKSYPWNDAFNKIKNFGLGLVDNKKSFMTSRWQGDSHSFVYTFTEGNIPDWLRSSIPCDLKLVRIFAIEPRSVGIIHKDGIDTLCAFNIPIVNTDNSTMDWFDPSEYSELLVNVSNNNNKINNLRVTKEQLLINKEVETTPYFSKIIEFPSLVNVNEFHRINNRNSDNYRWVLSLRFANNPTFNNVEKMFDETFI
jgi:hypothetical protein